jgi:hypothetical protein
MSTFNYTLTRGPDDTEIPVTVDYDYDPPCRGYRNSYGVPEEPDDPGGIVINSVTDADAHEVTMTGDEIADIEEAIGEHLAELSEPDPDRERD